MQAKDHLKLRCKNDCFHGATGQKGNDQVKSWILGLLHWNPDDLRCMCIKWLAEWDHFVSNRGEELLHTAEMAGIEIDMDAYEV